MKIKYPDGNVVETNIELNRDDLKMSKGLKELVQLK